MYESNSAPNNYEHCVLCGSSQLVVYTILKDDYTIFVCKNCTNALTLPKPNALYDDHPFFSHVALDEKRWRSYSYQIAKFIRTHYSPPARLLDVGCSHGLLLEEAQKMGFDVQGIEPSRSAVDYCRARGLNIQHGYLVDNVFPAHSFDIVVMSHVIEHVENPVQLLNLAAKLLSPNGVLCLCQTNYQGTLPRYLKRYWNYWVQHEHYYHFSLKGLNYILHNAGLQVVAEELLPLGYQLDFQVKSLRRIPTVVLNTFNYMISHWRVGFPYYGDQMYVLASPLSELKSL